MPFVQATAGLAHGYNGVAAHSVVLAAFQLQPQRVAVAATHDLVEHYHIEGLYLVGLAP